MESARRAGGADRGGEPPPVVAFVAPSGTGKTTLLEAVIGGLRRRGYRIGVVKHHHRPLSLDRPGTDTDRLRGAGASAVVLASPGGLAITCGDDAGEMALDAIAAGCLAGVDLVLAEGYKRGSHRKIEVHRSETGQGFLCVGPDGEAIDSGLLAVVSDTGAKLGVPLLPLDDPERVCDLLEGVIRSGG